MKKNSFFIVLNIVLLPTPLAAFWPFTESKQLTPHKQEEKRVAELKQVQNDDPKNPEANYNLGVGYYNLSEFDKKEANFVRADANLNLAKTSFADALEHVQKNKTLEEQCRLNIANLSVKQALSSLPSDWKQEAVKLYPQTLDNAIELTKNAITNYEEILKKNKNNKRAKLNNKKAKEILEALEKKREKQQQENKQDQQSQRDNQEKEGQKDGQQNEGQGDREGNPNQSQDKKTGGNDQKLDQKNDKDKQQNKFDHQQTPQQQEPSQQKSTKPESEKQQSAQEASASAAEQQKGTGESGTKESMEERAMRALLENLQSDEAKTQKDMLRRQQAYEQRKHPPVPGQKLW